MESKKAANLIGTLAVGNVLGEGVQWHINSQTLWWIDIDSACLFSYSPVTTEIITHEFPEKIGSFCFIENDERLLVALASGFAFFCLQSKKVQWLAQPELTIADNRFNDGRVDRQGRFWAGTMDTAEQQPIAALYQLDHNQNSTKMLDNIIVSNGLCWSPNGDVLYHADSPTRVIYKYDMDVTSGQLTNKTEFTKLPADQYPDGSTIDSQGALWNAQWGGSQVVCYSPTSDVELVIELPVTQPTCVCIGGENMDVLFVTSAKKGLSDKQLKEQPLAGNVFMYQLTNVKGIEENQYILRD